MECISVSSISATARCPWRRAPCPTLPYIYLHLKICTDIIMNPTTCIYIHPRWQHWQFISLSIDSPGRFYSSTILTTSSGHELYRNHKFRQRKFFPFVHLFNYCFKILFGSRARTIERETKKNKLEVKICPPPPQNKRKHSILRI